MGRKTAGNRALPSEVACEKESVNSNEEESDDGSGDNQKTGLFSSSKAKICTKSNVNCSNEGPNGREIMQKEIKPRQGETKS